MFKHSPPILRRLPFKCFGMLLLAAALTAGTAKAQQVHPVTGRVTDETNNPLPGVSVAVKGTTAGAATDANGNFNIKNAPNATGILVLTFMGYATQEVAYTSGKPVLVSLKTDQKALGEVVVVGYGTQKKVNLVGAVSAVKVDEKITNRSLPNASSALSGLVPGLAVSQSTGMAGRNGAALVIRGLGSVNNANPLVVVDGMPDVDINRLNMNDIESVSVLKDATSAAVYGSRAANGVILITTKSGKGQKRTAINFNGTFGLQKPTRAYDFMADYARGLTLHQRQASTGTSRNNWRFKDGTIDQWMALGMIDPLAYPNTDWWDVIIRDGQLQNYNLSASGGNEQSNFFMSVGVIDEKGLQINNDYKQYNARFSYDYKVRKNMNAGVKFNGNWSKSVFALEDGFTDDNSTNTAGFDMQYAIAGITPWDPVTNRYGGVMAYGEDVQAYNPYTVYVNTLNRLNRQEANGQVYFDWSPIEGLTGRIDYSLNYYNQFRWNANMPNQAWNFQTNSPGSRVYVGDNAGISNNTATGYKTMMSGRINYNRTFAKNHQVAVMAAYSEEYWNERVQNSSRNDRIHPDLHEVDAALPGIQGASGNSGAEGLRSYIGRVNYTAFDKYLLEANFRYDGSSKFLDGHRFGFFPSIAVGWRFTEENFIKPITGKVLSSGKLRASYGSLGNNSGVGRYEQQSTLSVSNYMIGSDISKGFVYKKMVNENLTWETTTVFNLGLDLGFLENRLTAELDYYDRLTTDMLRPSDLSQLLAGAYIAPRQNIGELRNRGIEGNINWSDRVGQFHYGLNFNASYNRTNLERWNEFLPKGWIYLDMPYHFLITYQDEGIARNWQDIYNTTPQGAAPGDLLRKDVNGDGRISDDDKVAYDNVQRDRPTANYALSGNVSWKGIDVAFLFTAATGRKDYWINNYNNVNPAASRYAWGWNQWYLPFNYDNMNGAWPRLGGSGNNRSETTFWLDNLNYIRFKNIQVGYSIPGDILKKIGLYSFRVFASAENIGTITKFRGLDPELTGNRSNAYPLNKSYSFGINVGL